MPLKKNIAIDIMQKKIFSIDERKKKVKQKKGEISTGTRSDCVGFFFSIKFI